MKVIHLADIHWRGLSRHEEYRESFSLFLDKAKELQPDIIYVGGDIVHNKTQGISPELIDCLSWWFTSLSDIAPTHVILGNHDGLVFNKDRQDAITPIIDALDNPNIFLYKDSGTYPIKNHPGFNWCVFSCFDLEGWKNVELVEGEINIALFHGAVWGSKTDRDWEIEGDITTDFFEDYDFALLGDIHKRQFLNNKKTVAYCGSSIQQNYGEDPGKGFLFWDIKNSEDFDVKFYEIPHSQPFVTIDWKGSVSETVDFASKFPYGTRFRVRSKETLNQANTKQLQEELIRTNEATEVVFKSETSLDISKIQMSTGILNKENLRDSNTHKSLLEDYYKDRDEEKETISDLCNLAEKYLSQITDDKEVLRNTRWQINSLRFSNLFSYGEENLINFENLQGITGIFGINARGKSSIIGSLMYCLFNTTDRGSIKNLHIVNSRKNNCLASVEISVNGDPFRITRSTVKHQTRKGEVYASTGLNLHKLDSDGNVLEDLTEEQRRETEKILRKIIGNAEDFLMTSLAAQGEMNTFIKEGATSRKMILTKFLDLEIFEKMHDIAKNESADIRARVRAYPDIDWDESIDNFLLDIDKNKASLEALEKDISLKRESMSNLKVDLATSGNPNIVTQIEYDNQEKDAQACNEEVLSLEKNIENIEERLKDKESKNTKIELVKSDFSIGSLRERLADQERLERRIVELNHEYDIRKKELERQKKSISKLGEVPCGDSFPTCKFIKDSHRDKGKIDNQIDLVSTSLLVLEDTKTHLIAMTRESIKEKIEKYESLIALQSSLSLEISELKIALNNALNDLERASDNFKKSNNLLDSMGERLVVGSEDPASIIRSSIVSLESKIITMDGDRTDILENLAGFKIQLSKMKQDRRQFETYKRELHVYDLFIKAVSKKGIPLQIMLSQLPLINEEISKILQGVTKFTVELEANSDSNVMDVFINYGDSRRVIELASGMEKMMSSLAIRVALINVSSLTKTNTLIIDEGFGTLDDNNIEACGRLLESLKKWFRNIVIISHVDAIKDVVDNSLEITKNGKNSKVFSR